jgi:hypothetical protein
MKCPYCGKRVGDMPDHLDQKKECHNKHILKLSCFLQSVIRKAQTKDEVFIEEQE